MRHTAFLVLALLAAPAAAQEGPQPFLEDGETIETDLRADLNADGLPDYAYVASREDSRELRVVTTYRDETDGGENPVQRLLLDPYPLADAALSVKSSARGAVLVMEEVTGGTTAIFSTHRFRWAKGLGVMRLIGLDAMLYSRTFAHDGREASWNLVTGELVTRNLRRNTRGGEAAYDKVDEQRTRKPSPVLVIEESPDGAALLGWPEGE